MQPSFFHPKSDFSAPSNLSGLSLEFLGTAGTGSLVFKNVGTGLHGAIKVWTVLPLAAEGHNPTENQPVGPTCCL
jgi:hypothetical protein